jgi:hypothetical protein
MVSALRLLSPGGNSTAMSCAWIYNYFGKLTAVGLDWRKDTVPVGETCITQPGAQLHVQKRLIG